MQNPATARRCGTDGRTGHHRRERGNDDGNRDRDGDEKENKCGNEHEGKHGGKNWRGNRDENRDEGGGEREPENLLRRGRRSRSEDARGTAMPTSNQQLQPPDLTPQRDRPGMGGKGWE